MDQEQPEIDFMEVVPNTLGELFGGDRSFIIPWFQRAYAWEPPRAAALLSDLIAHAERQGPRRRYHLGTIKLANGGASTVWPNASRPASIVDGHQRIVTFTILFAVLRDLDLVEGMSRRLAAMIELPSVNSGEATSSPPVHFRLNPQPAVSSLFAELVQKPAATREPLDHGFDPLSVSERNIIENRDYFRLQLSSEDWTPERRTALADYLIASCQVVCETWQDEDEAWRYFQLDEETQLPFDEASKIKSGLLEVFPGTERYEANLLWQELEKLLGQADVFALLGHIRTLKLRRRSEAPLEQDLIRAFQLDRNGLGFLKDDVLPQAYRLEAIRRHAIAGRPVPEPVRSALIHLDWINPNVWVPAALHWIEMRGVDDPEHTAFFARLEALVWCMRIAGTDPRTAENRIIRLLAEIEAGTSVAAMQEFEIDKKTIASALENLRSPNFRDKHFAVSVLRRLSVIWGADPGPVDGSRVTIEHILPQNVPKRAPWLKIIGSKNKARKHINRLGNLTFLSEADNQRAGTLPWNDKRQIFKRSAFVLSQRAAEEEEWSVKVIERRTDELIAALFAAWGIPV